MSQVDGKWEVTVTSPMGAQKITTELATSGAVLSGTMTGAMGSAPISGTAEGDTFSFASNITTPFPINIEFKGRFEMTKIAEWSDQDDKNRAAAEAKKPKEDLDKYKTLPDVPAPAKPAQ